MVGPRQLFYVTAILALLIGGSVVFYSSISLGNTITLVLAAVVFVVAMVAARREGRVSEQSHPMNLPIFG
jgi:membrane protein implicated in regulation of membrane protease activity